MSCNCNNTTPCNCGCNCNNIVTTPCTTGVGCTSTNYAKCIQYSGSNITSCVTITYGDNLDTVINAIVTAMCALTPQGIQWSTFNYGCLTVTPYATAEAFAEGISAAHCALATDVAALEAPVFSTCTLFASGPYTITPGTTTLQTILNYYGLVLCSLEADSPANATVAANCFSSNSGIDTFEDWIQWIVDNVCLIKATTDASITSLQNSTTAFQNYLGAAGSLASKHDLSCLGGGATETAYSSINSLITNVCNLNTSVSALPNLAALTLNWAGCYGYTSTEPLITQLNRIITRLKLNDYTFNTSDFVVTTGSCGKSISLSASVGAFSCSDLNGCSIHNLGDVTATLPTLAECGYALRWNNTTAQYELKADATFQSLTSLGNAYGIVNQSGSYSAAPLGFYFEETPGATCADPSTYTAGFVEKAWTAVSSFQPDYASSVTQPLSVKKTWDGNIYFKGVLNSISSPSNNAFNIPAGKALFTLPTGFYPTLSTTTIDLAIVYTPLNAVTTTAISIQGYATINGSTGLVTFFCNDGDAVATAAAITALGNSNQHYFVFQGKAIYQ